MSGNQAAIKRQSAAVKSGNQAAIKRQSATIKRQSSGNRKRQSGGNQAAIRRQSGGNQAAIKWQSSVLRGELHTAGGLAIFIINTVLRSTITGSCHINNRTQRALASTQGIFGVTARTISNQRCYALKQLALQICVTLYMPPAHAVCSFTPQGNHQTPCTPVGMLTTELHQTALACVLTLLCCEKAPRIL